MAGGGGGGDSDWTSSRGEEGESIILSVEGDKETRHRMVERSNILGIVNLVVKGLIEMSMQQGKTLNDAHPQLQQCLIAIEQALKHGLKTKRSMLGQKKTFWGVVESFEKSTSEFYESIGNVRCLPSIRTAAGRGRAWLRFGIMQKKLGEHFRTMTDDRAKLREWYEMESVMASDEGQVLAGLLMGLNAIDYNMTIYGDEFDKSVGPLDLAQFLRDGNYGITPPSKDSTSPESDSSQLELAQLLDQKAYLEEHNRKLELSVEKLQQRVGEGERRVTELEERVKEEEEETERLSKERDDLREMNERSSAELRRALETLQDDQKTELETYIQSRAGLNDLYSATQRNLDTESRRRTHLEQELDILKTARAEKETAMLLLEKSVHEKQDSIIALRKQLEEVKSVNIKMTSQLKVAQETHQKDSLKIRGIENKLSQTTANLKKSDKDLQEMRSVLKDSEKTCSELGQKLHDVQLARSTAEQDLSIEKQWRASLQMEIQREKDRVVEVTNELKKTRVLKKEHTELEEKYACLQETVSEQEIALVEMGKQLSIAQEKLSDMKHVRSVMKDSVWVDDREISDCQLCTSTFSVSRRKHHCRHCGGVFCNSCSDNSLQLASSSKPVRVCDTCYTMLLERSSS